MAAPTTIAHQHPSLTKLPESPDGKPRCECVSKLSPFNKQFSDFLISFKTQRNVLDTLYTNVLTTTRLLLSLERSDTTSRGRWSPDRPLTPINVSAVVLDWLSVDPEHDSRTLMNGVNDGPTPNILGFRPPYDRDREAWVRTLPWFEAVSDDGPQLIANIFYDVYCNTICPANGVFAQTLILKKYFQDLWDAHCNVENTLRDCCEECTNDHNGREFFTARISEHTVETYMTVRDAQDVLSDYISNMFAVVASFRSMMQALISGMKASQRKEEEAGNDDLADRIREAVDALRELRALSSSEFKAFEAFVSDLKAKGTPEVVVVESYKPSGSDG